MYRNHLVAIVITFVITFILSYLFSMKYSVETSNQIITVLSIFFGFYVTSASLVLTGDAVKILHETVDVRGNKRLTHTLRDYYSFGLINLLLGLVVFILVSLFFNFETPQLSGFDVSFTWIKFVSAFATANLMTNLVFGYIQTRLFLVLLLNEAYAKNDKS